MRAWAEDGSEELAHVRTSININNVEGCEGRTVAYIHTRTTSIRLFRKASLTVFLVFRSSDLRFRVISREPSHDLTSLNTRKLRQEELDLALIRGENTEI